MEYYDDVLARVREEFPTLSSFAQEHIARFVEKLQMRVPTRAEYRRMVIAQSKRDGFEKTSKKLGIGRTSLYRWRKEVSL